MRFSQRRSINAPFLAAALLTGASLGTGTHLLWPETFSWWFVVATSVAAIFVLGAYFRRHRWEERSTCVAIAALALVLPVIDHPWLWWSGLLLLAGYYWLLHFEQAQREKQ